jgi:hypothetical protein
VLLAPERILFIGRQVNTDLNKAIDLLAVDARRRLVVIELKKDRAPRDMVAQALEYAASVRRLPYDALNTIAVPYFSRRGQPWESLSEAHQEFFGDESYGGDNEAVANDWNPSQIVILVGQTISPEVINVSRYLRDHDIDVRVLQFTYLESSSGERLVNTQIVVGTEPMPSEVSSTVTQGLTLEQLLAKVPETEPAFTRLKGDFKQIGLLPRAGRASVSFDRARGEPLVNMWPSQGGYVIVLIIGRRATRLGDLDHFQAAVEALKFDVRRGRSDLSVHVQPSDLARVPELAAAVKEHFLSST